MKLRTSEGRNGVLSALILPHGEKTALSLEIPIKALNLHTRLQVSDSQLLSLPVSTIKLEGSFDVEEALSWLNSCLPDVPMSTQDSNVVFGYKSAFLGTLLQLTIRDKSIVVKTDNLSVLAIIKESLSASATQRKTKVNIEMPEIEYQSVQCVIDTVYPLVARQYTIAQKYQLIDGLKELAAGEDDLSFLSEEYRDILSQADSIK